MILPKQAASPAVNSKQQAHPLAAVVRVLWLVVGNLALVVLIVFIVRRETFSVLDLLYWLTFVSVVLARFLDIRYLGGTTLGGAPATLADWRRHAALLLAVVGSTWGLERLLSLLSRY
jgi:hypothetical protein